MSALSPRHFLTLIFLASFIALGLPASALETEQADFGPTWKLLNTQEKQQFISGYLHGWKDARVVTDIAAKYVRENPDQAVQGMEKIRELYNLSDLRPEGLVRQIDAFFQQPENSRASLSRAISAAKSAAKQGQ